MNMTAFWDHFLGGLPDVLVAIIVLILAFLVAWIVKKAFMGLFKLIKVDKLIAKTGLKEKSVTQVQGFLGNLVYLMVFVLFLPGVFDKLGMNSVSTPIVAMMNGLLAYLPNIIAATLLLMIGVFLGKTVKELLAPALKGMKLDAWLEKVGLTLKGKMTVSDILAVLVQVAIVVIFFVEALNALQLDVLTHVGADIVAYLPFAASAVIIILAAVLVGNFVEKLINKSFKDARVTALIAKVTVIVLGAFITLYQLGIAPELINSAFVLVLGAVAVAFAISFGVGGRDFAKHRLDKLEKKIDGRTSQNHKK